MKPTVLIVDDHASFRRFARRLLDAAGYTVVGESATAEAAIERAEALQPDVVLLDVLLPDGTGFEVADALAGSGTSVVLVSSRSASEYGKRLEAAPAVGFIPKGDLSAQSLQAVLNEC